MPPDSAAPKPAPIPSAVPLLERTLGSDWRCLTDAVICVGNESGPVDLAALHPVHGVVLVALLRKGEEACPAAAAESFRAMLRELDFAARFPGELHVAAIALDHARRDRLAAAIREAAGPLPESPPEPCWIDWLAERLRGTGRRELRLVAAAAETPPEPALRLDGPRERLLPPEPAQPARWWGAALAVVAMLAIALAAAAALYFGFGPTRLG